MGLLLKGILGGFKGTVGTVIGGYWKGMAYIKSLPVISNTDPTPGQLEYREKFKTVVDFLRPMMDVIQFGFKSLAVDQTPYNAAFAYNHKYALDGTYPNFSIKYDAALVTYGTLPNVVAPTATAEPASEVKFTWGDNSGLGKAAATDKMIMVVYCPEIGEAIYQVATQERNALTATISAAYFSGKSVHTWLSVMNNESKLMAKSVYTGELTVS